MDKFTFIKTQIQDVYIIETSVFGDNRGYFMETYNEIDFKAVGLDMKFVQDNQLKSKKVYFVDFIFKKIILKVN